ncbi:MAG: MBL fold metallo-hydrolase, partial [Bacteroidetes bacterium]|nr:MBL fold metallo-hydrolase [Bacteroidota bacterium]
DVGQGDAILLEHPDGRTAMIDTGPVPFDERSGLVPFLKRRGIEELDLVVITHPHDDHSGGLPLVRRSIGVKQLITHATAQPGTLIAWKEDCRLQVLNAVARIDTVENPGRDLNRLSVVIRLVYGETAFIFAADAEHFEESRMIGVFGEGLRSTVLKVGHHGSRAATTGGWLDVIRPAYAIISVGRHNKFGHPSPLVLRRLRERGIVVLRTDEEGAVMMVSDGKRVRREEWR